LCASLRSSALQHDRKEVGDNHTFYHKSKGRLAAIWRYILCQQLRQAYPHDRQLQRIINDLYQKWKGLQVYMDSFYPKGVAAAAYIGRYMGHPPLAMSHLFASGASLH
jgi:hypothetical protein